MKKSWLNHSICCDANLGPIFGCNDIRIENTNILKEMDSVDDILYKVPEIY